MKSAAKTISRITSPVDLANLKKDILTKQQTCARDCTHRILICMGGGCIASGSTQIRDNLKAELKKNKLDKSVIITETGCLGPCAAGPVLTVMPDGTFYQDIKPEDVTLIVKDHIMAGKPVEKLLNKDQITGKANAKAENIEFFKQQTKIVLRNCGIIDPLNIEDYIAREGYSALANILAKMKPEDVIAEMKVSGLRGRGGAGFPTWMKWDFARQSQGKVKYVLCNADEGDPGAFMDRSVLEGDPHSIIEGMTIAAFAVGAHEGYVYVRAEYPLAVERLSAAITAAKKRGLLGRKIFGTDFSFDLEIRMGSGAFVCGEETALMTSIEGKRGEPRPRPPFPAVKGLFDKPSVLNNVETYANVPVIFQKGASWYAGFGTAKSKGTKVFALAGAVVNTGLVEVPVGTTLGQLIYDIGGGIKDNREYKAAQIGGPSGGCIPKQHLNVALDYESLQELGAIMGSGGLIVMDDQTCMVDVARFFLEFVQEESCGKCVPCRVGTKRMLEILERITSGAGEEEDIDRLIELGNIIKETALCGLGQTAPNPVLSTIRHFRHEYEEHIRNKRCEAGVCPKLVRAPCQSACPAQVDVPGFVALVSQKRYAEALRVHRERNPFAAVCARVCFHTCENKCRRASLDDSVAIRAVKRFMVDQEVTIQLPRMIEDPVAAARKVAIVGAGPAGLSAAYFLARLGYKPVVFESEPRPGGMLVQTIPAYRLPREVLAREIRMIEHMGVELKTGKKLGKDFSLKQLREEGYDSIFLGIGAQKPVTLGVPGEDAEGVVESLDFLREYNIRGSVPVGKNVIVVGGGNAAIDAARTAQRLGAKSVTIIYRRTREEMPAYDEEIHEAIQEGVQLKLLTAPVSIVKKNNKVEGIILRNMHLGDFDSSGRRRPEGEEGHDFTIPADQIIVAIGQRFEGSHLKNDVDLELTKWGTPVVNEKTGQTSVSWLFAGGDAVTGPASVINAVAAGERAAAGIDLLLTGEDQAFWRADNTVDVAFDPDKEPVPYQREKLPLIAVERRSNNFDEVELVWSEGVAVRQAERCLRCDYGKPCK